MSETSDSAPPPAVPHGAARGSLFTGATALHDELVQMLFAAGLALAEAVSVDPRDELVESARRALDGAIQALMRYEFDQELTALASEQQWSQGLVESAASAGSAGSGEIYDGLRAAVSEEARPASQTRRPSRYFHSGELWKVLIACEREPGLILEEAARLLCDSLGDEVVATRLSNEGILEPIAFLSRDPEAQKRMGGLFANAEFRLGEGLAGEVAASGMPLFVPIVPPDVTRALVGEPSRSYLDDYPMTSLIIVPVIAQGRVLGTLGVTRHDPEAPFADGDLMIVEQVAELAALAVTRGEPSTPVPHEDVSLAIFEHALHGVLFSKPDGSILAANPAACELLGLTEEEICREGRLARMVTDDPRWRAALNERARTGRARAVLPMRRANGEVFDADVSSVIFVTETGDAHSYVMFQEVEDTTAFPLSPEAVRTGARQGT
jgi:PAS domain S-box-containing protein